MCYLFAECFVESIPQFHLTLILRLIIVAEDWSTWEELILYLLSLPTSLVSATIGMSRILMNGPSKLVKKSDESCSGWGFALLNMSLICVIVSKSKCIGVISMLLGFIGLSYESTELAIILIWISISFLPQCLLVRKCSDFFKSFQY